jgi:Lrp/AsnC family transcriptional regulator for asnA, asnC and gidA
LKDSGKLQIVGMVEPKEAGWNEASMIGITAQTNKIDEVADAIAQLPEVSYLCQAAGEFDLIAEVFCKDREHYVQFLNRKLQQIPGVERTRSFLILKMHKLSFRWGQAEPPSGGQILLGEDSKQKEIP